MHKFGYEFDLVDGMTQGVPAHLCPKGKWTFAKNAQFRKGTVAQTPGSVDMWVLGNGDITPVSLITPYVSDSYQTVVVCLTGVGLYLLDFGAGLAYAVAMPGGYSVDIASDERWSALARGSNLYFGNRLNGLFKFDGLAVTALVTSTIQYRPKYTEEFFDHLVVANVTDGVTNYPLRIAYSDLGLFNDFDPTTVNEADFFELTNNEANALYGLGITGLKKIGDQVAIYTCGSVWNMRYVGFENGVMTFAEQINGVGCWLPYSLVGMDRYHVFISVDGFYMYDGTSLTPIGHDIDKFFLGDLTQDPYLRTRTWGHVNLPSREIRWYYPTTQSTGECNGCVVFNWESKVWYTESGFNRNAALTAGTKTFRWIDLLPTVSATIDGLIAVSATIDGLALYKILPQSIYTDRNGSGSFTTDATLAVPGSTENENGTPITTLITGDYALSENAQIKEIDGILFDAEAPEFDTKYGWEIYISVRDYLASSVVFEFYALFDGTEVTKRVGVRLAGRVLRFKFVSRNIALAKFYGFGQADYVTPSEK